MNFQKDFFLDEIRSGFMIPEMMKRAWAAQMELLEIISDICQKHDILWYANSGTLLGAVRHHGFIPWDDDIDIELLRPDYNRLLSLLSTELPDGFALSGTYAESEPLQKLNQVVQARVITDPFYWDFSDYLKRFHGFPVNAVGIDIFPIDYLPRDPELAGLQRGILQKIWILLKKEQADTAFSLPDCDKELTEIEELCSVTLVRDHSLSHQLYQLFDSVSALFTEKESDFTVNFQFYITYPERCYSKQCYDWRIFLPFEHILVPAPAGYDEILTKAYGDYHNPVRGTADHDYPFYAAQMESVEKLLREKGITKSVTEFCRDFMEEGGFV